MNSDERWKRNEAVLGKLNLKDTLTQYQSGERITGRGNVFINLICLLVHLKRKEGRSWILEQIGTPDWSEDMGSATHLHYRLKFSKCHCKQEHWAMILLKEDRLDGFATYDDPNPVPGTDPHEGQPHTA
ncbi:MAG: hypothetical protein HY343_10765 [Lentisphaerae bacterium]|nr:hypothetical protein [Lentisphaerota bacterium]